MMLKKKFRFPFRARFGSFRQRAFPQFDLKTKENKLSVSRAAIVVSKKIDKRAVVRNRIRRIISNCLEELWMDLKVGFDLLLIVKRDARDQARQKMFEIIKQAFAKEGLLK